jgi:alpha-glucan,water dikinase
MATKEKITAKSGMTLLIQTRMTGDKIQVSIQTGKHKGCLLHWGLRRHNTAPWQSPPTSIWPKGTNAFDQKAVRTPFVNNHGARKIAITLKRSSGFSSIPFVLYFPEQDTWDNNGGKNYQILLPKPETRYSEVVQRIEDHLRDKAVVHKHVYGLENDYHLGVGVTQGKGQYHVTFVTDISEPVVLHWGVANHSRHEWVLPPSLLRPTGTTVSKGKSAETPFHNQQGLNVLQLVMKENKAPLGIAFVLKIPDGDIWLKDQGRNFLIPVVLPPEYKTALKDPKLAGLADEIIDRETGHHSWTLMHRFNLCYDLLDKAGFDRQGSALIFVWLRFSAIRQLDWQRNYNTQPRELSHAQDRLTQKLAGIYAGKPEGHEFVRLMLTTMGRGGEGQRVRDEVLNIMHRHHIKEVSGHFMEEWHQKLHNNTTPDDMVICQAYIDFLRSNGNLDCFYKQLEAGGVTKNRLESYERPILSHPDFIPHLKDALIYDFEKFLKILRGVHAGADLETAIQAASPALDPEMQGLTGFIWNHRDDTNTAVVTMAGKITEARQRLSARIDKQEGNVRDLLFLDLALEDFLRVVIERNFQEALSGQDLVAITAMVLKNLLFATQDEEMACCLRHWERLTESSTFERLWSLEAKAVLDRLGRVIGNMIDQYHQVLQPKAELLGKAFQAEPWTISLFTEEVVRGRLVFLLSVLLRKIDPLLRKSAHMGNWQIVSPGHGTGKLLVVNTLQSVQGERFSHQTVVLANNISGQEEIPEKITAVLTADTTDIVSHVAIRARNGGVLLATCYDQKIVEDLEALEGHQVSVRTNAAGDVIFERTTEKEEIPIRSTPIAHTPWHRPEFTAYAVTRHDFDENVLGGKSNNLNRLQGNLPPWIGIPRSAAIPFGVFEKVLTDDANKKIAGDYDRLVEQIEQADDKSRKGILLGLHQAIGELKAPEAMMSSLQRAIEDTGLPWPANWEQAWTCIKNVWASKWNERAFLSRQTAGIAHENLFMAVLIQEVVAADYSFVIHTANPFSKDSDEVYAEVVPGLGETLVGNYPGRALSFTCKKDAGKPALHAFPSKSIGLFGGGLIFRSDSNGEDLADFAGAGLYDSHMLQQPQRRVLDYTKTPLVVDDNFQSDLLEHIAAIGIAIENLLAVPQDIEGAYAAGKYFVVQTRPQVGVESEQKP